MLRLQFRWIWMGAACLIIVSAACREREPVPCHNRDLGSQERHLLPTPPPQAGEKLTGTGRVEIPRGSEVGETDSPDDTLIEEDSRKGAISSFVGWLRGAGTSDADADADTDTDEEEDTAPQEE
ncbi:MAG: hypothetical protein KAV82_11565 [Phycisphaerae bacterium]|nr:hypothetical protein [Phycisphaerae bacterium]